MSHAVQQSTLPITASIGFALQGLRLRIGRMSLVVLGIASAMAFTTALLVLDRLYAQVPPQLRAEQSGPVASSFRWMWIAVALLISTAGTFNAVLMSVTERVKEIGTLKCLGARDRHVIGMFLFESLLLGAVAGLLGGLAGLAIAAGTFCAQAGSRYLTVPALVVDDAQGAFTAQTGLWYRPKLGYQFRCNHCGKMILADKPAGPAACPYCHRTGTISPVARPSEPRGRQLIRPPDHPDLGLSAALQELSDAKYMLLEPSPTAAQAAWRLSAAVAGPYDVEVFIPALPHLNASVQYRLVCPGSTRTVTLDQADPAVQGRWTRLGRLDLPAAATLTVQLHAPPNTAAVADRVRIDKAFISPLLHMLPWILYSPGISMSLSLLAAVVPVWIAARVEPAAAMRYDV